MQEDIDNLNQRMDELEQSVSDTSDQTQETADDIESRVEDLEANIGQLVFPLSQDTIDLIKEQFPIGTITLVAGTADIVDDRISTGSVIIYSRSKTNGGNLGHLYISSQIPKKATITSSDPADVSDVYYLIMS